LTAGGFPEKSGAMSKFLLPLLAAVPLILSSCIPFADRYGAGIGEHERWYADGHVRSRYYAGTYYYNPKSVHDAHVRVRGPAATPYRTLASGVTDTEGNYTSEGRYYDPNSVHDAYARKRRHWRPYWPIGEDRDRID